MSKLAILQPDTKLAKMTLTRYRDHVYKLQQLVQELYIESVRNWGYSLCLTGHVKPMT